MKIVFFSRLFYPHIGGVEKHVYKISQLLVKKGHEVIVVTEKYDSKLNDKDSFSGITIIRVSIGKNNFTKKFKIWRWLLNNLSVIKNSDIIHCHDIFYWYMPFRFIFPTKKVYVTFHGYEGNNIPGWRSKLSHKIAEVLTYGNICVGDYLAKWYGTNPTIVTYGAIDKIKENAIIPKKDSAVFIGRLEEEANIMNYLKALNILKRQGFELKLTVLGDGSKREEAEKFVLKNNLNVKFLGFVEDVYKYISDYEYIFTSRFLGTLEGLSVKRFVFVVYNNEILKDCFILSPFKKSISISGNYHQLANQIKYIDSNKEVMKDRVKLGYNWVVKQTWNNMVNNYISLWNDK